MKTKNTMRHYFHSAYLNHILLANPDNLYMLRHFYMRRSYIVMKLSSMSFEINSIGIQKIKAYIKKKKKGIIHKFFNY